MYTPHALFPSGLAPNTAFYLQQFWYIFRLINMHQCFHTRLLVKGTFVLLSYYMYLFYIIKKCAFDFYTPDGKWRWDLCAPLDHAHKNNAYIHFHLENIQIHSGNKSSGKEFHFIIVHHMHVVLYFLEYPRYRGRTMEIKERWNNGNVFLA